MSKSLLTTNATENFVWSMPLRANTFLAAEHPLKILLFVSWRNFSQSAGLKEMK